MFSVLFEVQPKAPQWDAYLGYAKMLRPELERIDGFIDNIRYRSLTHEGWLLSLSNWRDEKALVRWRTQTAHHGVQEKGRFEVFEDYRLRVGQLTADTAPPQGLELTDQRLDETEVGAAKVVTLINATRPADLPEDAAASETARRLGLRPGASLLVGWDIYDTVLTPGDLILLLWWRDKTAAAAHAATTSLAPEMRRREVRVIREYGMFDRREAPQYYPEVRR